MTISICVAQSAPLEKQQEMEVYDCQNTTLEMITIKKDLLF